MRPVATLLLALTVACSDATGPSNPADALAEARSTWLRSGIADYQYTITRGCECTPESVGPVVIEVRNHQVQTRRYLTGTTVDPQFADLFATVPELFELINDAIQEPAAGLAVRYNAQYGYPETIQIDWVAGFADDEVSYHITDFTLLDAE
jgi:hypothetical protein